MRKIYGIGETVYDIIFRDDQPQRAVPGGSTFNSLISLGRCGLRPTMVTETGDDRVGRIITAFMEDNGVNTDCVTVNPGTKSHVSLAFLDKHNDAHYQFYKDHASASVQPHFPDFQSDDVVIFGSFFAVNPVIRSFTREFLQRAHDAGCILYYDINFRAAHKGDLLQVLGNIEENMRLATVVRGSAEDFDCLYGETSADAVYTQHVAPLCRNLIYTAGGGATLTFAGGTKREYAVAPITTVSTIGAGDNFNAGFVFGLASTQTTRSTLAHPTDAVISRLVASGHEFAANVCQSLDNYVDHDFARAAVKRLLFTKKAFLFDLDGVIIDTETQYERFWGAIGRKYHPEIPDFATRIKGSTLVAIHEKYFADDDTVRAEVDRELIEFEDTMRYDVFEGALAFLADIRRHGIPCAIVTSSNQKKMESLRAQQPTLTSHFDHVFTAEDAGRGKPFPDCYLNAARHFGLAPADCVVVEDSLNGLRAARASGAWVVGVATTHSANDVAKWADMTFAEIGRL